MDVIFLSEDKCSKDTKIRKSEEKKCKQAKCRRSPSFYRSRQGAFRVFGNFGEREWEFSEGVSQRIRLGKFIISPIPMFGMRWELIGELIRVYFGLVDYILHRLRL